jgi:ribosomal protein S18 acetylase RimI-like enzyme
MNQMLEKDEPAASRRTITGNDMNLTIRKATVEDSSELAVLMNLAGDGIPAFLWENMGDSGENPMAIGARRVARKEGGFSYLNAYVATCGGAIAGMLLGYKLSDPLDPGPLDEFPSVIRPLVELETLVPGSWYINAVATDAAYRREEVGRKLMKRAEQLAFESNAGVLSLIVAEENVPARRLYESLAYQVIAR